MKKYLISLLYIAFGVCSIVNISCTNENDDFIMSSKENIAATIANDDSIPRTRGGGSFNFSAEGGTAYTTCSVDCSGALLIDKYHYAHSDGLGCRSSIRSQSCDWYSVSVQNYTKVLVTVRPNNSYTPRSATISGGGTDDIYIYQVGKKPSSSTIKWDEAKKLYKITGPQWVDGYTDTTAAFSLSGPFLSSKDVRIYWSVHPHSNNLGGGTIVSGQGTTNVNILFPFDTSVGCTGVVKARIEPVDKPTEGFTIEYKLIML